MSSTGRQNSLIAVSALINETMESRGEIITMLEDEKISTAEAISLAGMLLKVATTVGFSILAARSNSEIKEMQT